MSKRHPTWREMHMDTAPEVEAFMFERLAEMTFAEKLAGVERLNRAGRQFLLMGLQRDYPNESDAQIRLRFAIALLGETLATKAYGQDVELGVQDA